MIFEIVVAAFCIMAVSLIGVLFTAKVAREFLSSRLSFLVSFSAGVFLVTSGALALEVFEIFAGNVWQGIGLILSGYLLAWFVEKVIPESHHHHDPHEHDGHSHNKAGARKLLVGDAIHNIGDGIILVPAFLASPALGLAVTASLIIHETLQEISEFFVLKQAGYSTKHALTLNFLTSSTILVGVGISYFAVVSHELEGLLLAIAAGFFIHVVVHDLLPKRTEHESTNKFLQHVLFVAIGLLLMATIANALGESHSHGAEDHHEEEGHHADEALHDIAPVQ
ncbi:ZIP family metal transporter [Patescibacteria group bacterium]|nr:ZIP family metal transporter [Patescibacteria group bacterium]